jgi:L-threonylcarbamoyladenylate synthase
MILIKPNKEGIKLAVKVLRQGGVAVFPTDTAYGLGGVFNLAKVVQRVLKIKNRRDPKFTLVASDLAQVQKFFKLNKSYLNLVKKYWPGPLSLVVSRRFSVRVPKNKIVRVLAQKVGRPLIATSANLSGRGNIYQAQQVAREFSNQKYRPDLVIDGGKLPKVKPSTVVKVKRGKVVVLREGPVKITNN